MSDAIGLGIDWGSTNLRAWAFDVDGAVVSEARRAIALKEARALGFGTVLQEILSRVALSAGLPIVACGMLGARDGWAEAPYVHCPARPDAFRKSARHLAQHDLWILPGAMTAHPQPDVMRGEETQLLGALAAGHDGLFCLPGTHSKWVRTTGDSTENFRTFVTGELFAVARTHSVFGQLTGDGAFDRRAFGLGVGAAKESPLLNALFQPRARVLTGGLSAVESSWFLSGCLISTEAITANPDREHVTLLADGDMSDLYSMAFKDLSIPFTAVSAEACTRDALFNALQHMTRDKTYA